jgi:hypothetical protein
MILPFRTGADGRFATASISFQHLPDQAGVLMTIRA